MEGKAQWHQWWICCSQVLSGDSLCGRTEVRFAAVTLEAAWGLCWQDDLKPLDCVRHVIYWHCHSSRKSIWRKQNCSARACYSALIATQYWKAVVFELRSLNIQLITLTTGLLMGKWRTFTFKQTVSPSLCMWNEIGHPADGLTVCWLWAGLPGGQQGEASMVTEAKWTQPQLFAAVHSCSLHVSLSPQTEQGVTVCGFTVQLQLAAGGPAPATTSASEFIWWEMIHQQQ